MGCTISITKETRKKLHLLKLEKNLLSLDGVIKYLIAVDEIANKMIKEQI